MVSGTGYFMPSNTTGDDHNANVTYTKTAAGLIYPASILLQLTLEILPSIAQQP
ncbi:MAG: hypothetical protein IPO32_00780 [Crocinitomicaceae bacterium]|nr:hypothetical protein [Crocinitomicaceae bacterium]